MKAISLRIMVSYMPDCLMVLSSKVGGWSPRRDIEGICDVPTVRSVTICGASLVDEFSPTSYIEAGFNEGGTVSFFYSWLFHQDTKHRLRRLRQRRKFSRGTSKKNAGMLLNRARSSARWAGGGMAPIPNGSRWSGRRAPSPIYTPGLLTTACSLVA